MTNVTWLINCRVDNSDVEDDNNFFRFFKSDVLVCSGNVEWAGLYFKIKYYDVLLDISLDVIRVNDIVDYYKLDLLYNVL